ncbi:hypothetical protein [Rhodoferax sp.]|uniref:hypothetical protein n=1 Tax=Rhodoferax sp. TaxID=50421 RepID=UPI00260A2B76|nr:hypothetical protein [Rhodoferax sp.]MDD2926462.1 hypothetical protein [Rhodoferax sp.]
MTACSAFLKHGARVVATVASGLALLAGCSGGGGSASQLRAHYVLAPVEGGTCSLLDLGGKTLAGPAVTKAGVAWLDLPAASGTVQLSCEGGTYLDEATGAASAGIRLRSYLELGAGEATAVATPLTELAVRLLGDRGPATDYQTLSSAVATAFGLDGIDIGRQVPVNLGNTVLADHAGGRYGAVLAALSQLQQDGSAGSQAAAVVDKLAGALSSSGRFKNVDLRDAVSTALEHLTTNTRLQPQITSTGETVLRDVFENMQHADVVATVWYVDTDNSSTQSGVASSTVASGSPSSMAIVGRNLHFGLAVTLGGAACELHDLQPLEDVEVGAQDDLLTADCPPRVAGTAELLIKDQSDVVSRTLITVQDEASIQQKRSASLAWALLPKAGTGPSSVSGQVTAVAPSINTSSGALRYDALKTFPVRGVVVELLDRDANDAVVMTGSTDGNGRYQFNGADAGKHVVVRVKAQLWQSRAPGVSTGAQWNITVRDNTSQGNPKAMYVLDSTPLTTVAGSNTLDVQAALGFDGNGNQAPASGAGRQSAPFSILEVVYSAVTKLQAVDPNVSLPELNIYWSSANVPGGDDKEKGQIGTSHFANSGNWPGLFILGKADVDTDEFDQGVIGHEFGHYLQSALSYSDNPGDTHANGDFKDASLAFGEGYGTAVGGLLTGSPIYTDSSGPQQQNGSVTDLTKPSPAGARKGFYAEESVGYVLYNMGVRHGFTPFWRAVSALKAGHHSATIFAFLNQFTRLYPALAISDLLATENIRSSDPLGALAAGSPPDPAIDATASKGANDLEQLYLNVALTPGTPVTLPAMLSADVPSFCVNRNLPGANRGNGLGLSRRFTFRASYTGNLGLQFLDDRGAAFNAQTWYLEARDETGSAVSVRDGESGGGVISVVEGRVYSIKMVIADPNSIYKGNRCGNRLNLWRLAA